MTYVAVPPTARSADDLLPAARALIDRSSDRLVGDPAVSVSCRAGCSACCSQAVPVSRAELRSVLRAIERLPAERRRLIDERIVSADAALAAAGIDESAFAAAGDDRAARRTVAMRYFRVDAPCPLLHDGVCSIRDDRPLACREYLVSSDPAHCADPIVQGEAGGSGTVVRIRSTTQVIAGFQEISTILGEPRSAVLAFALARPPEPLAPPGSTEPQSGPRLAGLLTRQTEPEPTEPV